MKTSMAFSFLDLRRYRWLPYLTIAMTVFAVLAGIILTRFVEYRLVEATGGELTLAASEVAEKLDRMLFERQGDGPICHQRSKERRHGADQSRHVPGADQF